MNLVSLQLSGFMLYGDKTPLNFPQGLLLVTGPNGSGKSTILEGVLWALYGQTLRDNPPLNVGTCSAELTAEVGGLTYLVQRSRKGKESTKLSLSIDGEPFNGQTPTQTQARITVAFGTFENFIASRVFSSEHVARFAAATDKERKGLLEEMLHLGQFDRALALCRNDLRTVQQSALKAETTSSRSAGQLAACEEALATSSKPPPGIPDNLDHLLATAKAAAAIVKKRWTDLRGVHATAQKATQGERSAHQSAEQAARAAGTKASAIQEKVRRSVSTESCPACLRTMGPKDKAALHDHYTQEAGQHLQERTTALSLAAQIEKDLIELQEQEATLAGDVLAAEQEHERLTTQAATWEKLQVAASIHARNRAEAQRAYDSAHQTHQERLQALEAIKGQLASLEQAEAILGLRGARTLLFGRGLSRLQSEVNISLAELGSHMRVEVSGTTTRASGVEVEAVSVKLSGAGGGNYRGASRGQRALIDVSFVLGLASYRGDTGGLLFFDETFDSLDEERVERVSEYLVALAKDGRQVVVISHMAALQSRFPSSSCWEVRLEDGKSRIS